jgi:hypothetical protein
MPVLFINNDGGGFAEYVEVTDAMMVENFFEEQLPGQKAEDYLIRVNRQPVSRDCVLQEGDRVTVTPTKIEGALSQ